MEIDDLFDIVTLIVILALFVPVTFKYSEPLFKGNVGGFNVQIEKTAKKVNYEIKIKEKMMTLTDIMYCLLVNDEEINGINKVELIIKGYNDCNFSSVEVEYKYEINIDENFKQNKEQILENKFKYINDVIDRESTTIYENFYIKLYVDNNGFRKWVITND